MSTVNEGTTSYIEATFKDRNGESAVPSAATWKVIDLVSKEVLQVETAIAPAATVTIAIPPSVNARFNTASDRETHRCIVTGSYGADDQVVGYYDFDVLEIN